MKLTLQLEDEVYEKALEKYGTPAGVARAAVQGLALLAPVAKGDRHFVIHGEDRREIEKIVQTTVADASDVVRHMKNMAAVKVGTVTRVFTADELIRLQTQAAFFGWTPEKFLELTSDEAIRYLMDRI